ncbi:MAG TPA: 1-phosphofructokinase [Herpetosiphonaceae bacterium]
MIYTVTLNPALDRELTVPALSFNDVLRAESVQNDVGGKGFNVSRMLASLGAESVALGFAGGPVGTWLREGLEALGIATDFVQIAGETRTNISIVATGHDQHIKVNEAGPTISADEQQQLRAKIRHLAQAGDWWVLAGSLPPGIAPTYYADLIHDIQAAGAKVLLDTSGAALTAGIAAQPFLAKPNSSEASTLTGIPIAAPDDALRAAAAIAGVAVVVISMGKDGALLVQSGHGWQATPPRIAESNPIGAGDSMVGGLVWALSRDLPPQDALRWAVACGAATASKPGTAVGSYADVERLQDEVILREVTA